jgi:hypothetical protein
MKLLIENWRKFANTHSDDDQIINEAIELCRTYKNGLLIPKNKNQKKFLDKLQEMVILFEQGELTRRQFAKGMGAGFAATAVGGGVARGAMSKTGKTAAGAESDGAQVGAGTKILGAGVQLLATAFDLLTLGAENFVTECFVDFLRKRKKPVEASDLSDELKICLQIIAEDYKLSRRKKRGQWGSDKDYARVAKSKLYIETFGAASPGTYNMAKNMQGTWSITDSLTSTDPLNNIYNTITHVNISLEGDSVRFRDVYDFNPAVNILGVEEAKKTRGVKEDPNFFKDENNFYEFVKNSTDGNLRVYRGRRKGWVEVGFFSRAGIENLSRFYIGLFNYPGFKINIELPIYQAGSMVAKKADPFFNPRVGKI